MFTADLPMMATFLKSFLSVKSAIDICRLLATDVNLVKGVGTKALTTTESAAAPHRSLLNNIVPVIQPASEQV